jgi:hypothetical protein
MADTMVQTELPDNPDVHVHSTRDDDALYVMLMNESRTNTHPVTINIDGFLPAKVGEEVTLSSREYFWNPCAGRADWNTEPAARSCHVADGMTITMPPYCVKVVKFNRKKLTWKRRGAEHTAEPGRPELRILLPETAPYDMEVEGWVRAYRAGSDRPFGGGIGQVRLAAEGDATIEPQSLSLPFPAGRFTLQPRAPGKLTVSAGTGDGLSARRTMTLTPVVLTDMVAWDFQSPQLDQPAASAHGHTSGAPAPSDRKALRLDFGDVTTDKNSNHLFALEKIPRGIPRERIGGVMFDLFVPEALKMAPNAEIQAVMQSTGAYWIPCGKVDLNRDRGTWRTVRLEIPDKKFLSVMDRAFSVRFITGMDFTINGTIYIDNLGFLLRPARR